MVSLGSPLLTDARLHELLDEALTMVAEAKQPYGGGLTSAEFGSWLTLKVVARMALEGDLQMRAVCSKFLAACNTILAECDEMLK